MKIGIDARFVGPKGTGLGKYTEELILNLQKIDEKNQYIIFLKKDNWEFLKLKSNFGREMADINWYSKEEQLNLPRIFAKKNLDLLHVPHFNVPVLYRKKFIVTIHDLIHHNFDKNTTTTKNPVVYRLKREAYKHIIKSAAQKSAKILVPSKSTAHEVQRTFSVPEEKIVVTYEAAEEEYFNAKPSSVNQEVQVKTPFLIYVGNVYPHKNISRLLDTYVILKSKKIDINLLIVSSRDVFWERLKKEIEEKELNDMVKVNEYCPPSELSALFTQATAYICPSLAEGFGIPGLNAMAAKIPVICSNIPTLKEVYSDAPLYFDPNNPEDIAKKIISLISSDKFKKEFIEKGSNQVKKYSWQKMAEQTLDVYKSLNN